MPSVGPLELLMIATIALIVFGPEKLPQIARQVGRYAAELRKIASEVRDEFEGSISLDEDEGHDELVAPEEAVHEPGAGPLPEEEDEDEPAKDKPADPDEVEH